LLKLDLGTAAANTSSGFTEISLYSQASTTCGPRAIGNRIWFMVEDRSSIAYYDVTTSTVTTISTPTANAGVSGLELDANGNPWFAEPTANNIGVFDTTTGTVHEYPIKTTNAGAYAIAIDRTRGIVWYSEQTANKLGCLPLTP
jgi:streptogramin lyase